METLEIQHTAVQGGHQVAQNSTTTTFFPLQAARSIGFPLTYTKLLKGLASLFDMFKYK